MGSFLLVSKVQGLEQGDGGDGTACGKAQDALWDLCRQLRNRHWGMENTCTKMALEPTENVSNGNTT